MIMKIDLDLKEAQTVIANGSLATLLQGLGRDEETPASVATAPPTLSTPAVIQTAPSVTAAPAASVIPTAATPSITADQIARAGGELIQQDASKFQALADLLTEFNAKDIFSLPPEQYGAFATRLRALGAKI